MSLKDRTRDVHKIGWLETTLQDLRYGARMLRRSPGFTVVAVLTLALGIGATTAIYQLLDAVRLRMLPVKNPQELALVRIANAGPADRSGNFSGRYAELTNPQWEMIRANQQAFSAIAAWGYSTFDLTTHGESRFTERGLWVSGEYFQVLGVTPLLGRVFSKEDDRRGCSSPGAVISYAFWQREFGGRDSVIGQKISLNNYPFEVIGVTPAKFYGAEVGRLFDVAIPLCADAILRGNFSRLDHRAHWWLTSIGRLKPGWTLEKATAQLAAISPGIFQETLDPTWSPNTVKSALGFRLSAFPGGSGISRLREQYDTSLWLLLAIAGVVLLIACANLANLLLARAKEREREIVVRQALGASRGRLIRQLLVESLLLATLGAGAGAWLAPILSESVLALISTPINPFFVALPMDWRILGFTAILGIVTCMLFGLAPALGATRATPAAAMRASGRGLTASRARFGLRRALVVSQVALSLLLLVSALLFARSLRNLLTLDAGFQQDGILETDVDLSRMNIPVEARLEVRRGILELVRAIPGVESAATATSVPTQGGWSQYFYVQEGEEKRKGYSNASVVSANYFQTLDIALLGGRDFDDHDAVASPRVAIVNEAFARKLLNGASPLGRYVQWEAERGTLGPPILIVGLVKNTKFNDLRSGFDPIVYFAASQDAQPGTFDNILIRSRRPLNSLMPSVKQAIERAQPGISFHFHDFKEQIRESLLQDELMATLTGFFGFLAALLATIGLYGLMSYMVLQRRNEIGIRMALGAGQQDIIRMILREGLTLLLMGLAAGVALTLISGQAASKMLFGLAPTDPLTLAMGVLLLAAVAAAASYLPARRAARVEPMEALRYE